MQWRAHLPEDCPPEDASSASGMFYRLIDGDEPKPEDFLSNRELNKSKPDKVAECEFCGVSVFSELREIISLRNSVPFFKRTKQVAKGNLVSQHGKIKNTLNGRHKSHHSWWIPVGIEPWHEFVVVELPQAEN